MFPWFKFSGYALAWFILTVPVAYCRPVKANEEFQGLKPVLSCPVAKAFSTDGLPVYFFQHRFPDGAQDLAIAKSQAATDADIKRVTFGGSNSDTCRNQYLAVERGGDWGWHLLWLADGSNTLRYARIDGEAWVTSPVKKIAEQVHAASQPYIFTSGLDLWVVWVEITPAANRIYAVYSDDEGRNWHDAKLIAEKAADLSDLKLVERNNKPYLAVTGLVELLPLISN